MSAEAAGGAADRTRREALRRLLNDLDGTRRRVEVDRASTANPLFVMGAVVVLWGFVGLAQDAVMDSAYRDAREAGQLLGGALVSQSWVGRPPSSICIRGCSGGTPAPPRWP